MRYEVRHNNKVWHTFDTVLYTAVAAYKTEREAFAHASRLNK